MSSDGPGHLGTETDVVLPRVGAFVVDYALSLAIGLGGPILVFATVGPIARLPFVLLALALIVAYHVIPEGLWGQTPGKRLFGVVVVKEDGSPCDLSASLTRNGFRLVDGMFSYAVGLIAMLVSDRAQRIGDSIAGTVVVRARR